MEPVLGVGGRCDAFIFLKIRAELQFISCMKKFKHEVAKNSSILSDPLGIWTHMYDDKRVWSSLRHDE